MPEYTVKFESAPDGRTMTLPRQLLRDNGRYAVKIQDGDVYITGNTNGLLYLAEVLVRCAMGGYVESFHIHLPFASSARAAAAEEQPELVIFAASEAEL